MLQQEHCVQQKLELHCFDVAKICHCCFPIYFRTNTDPSMDDKLQTDIILLLLISSPGRHPLVIVKENERQNEPILPHLEPHAIVSLTSVI